MKVGRRRGDLAEVTMNEIGVINMGLTAHEDVNLMEFIYPVGCLLACKVAVTVGIVCIIRFHSGRSAHDDVSKTCQALLVRHA